MNRRRAPATSCPRRGRPAPPPPPRPTGEGARPGRGHRSGARVEERPEAPADDLRGGARQEGQGRRVGPDDPVVAVEREHAHPEAVQHSGQLLLDDDLRRRARTVAHTGSLPRKLSPVDTGGTEARPFTAPGARGGTSATRGPYEGCFRPNSRRPTGHEDRRTITNTDPRDGPLRPPAPGGRGPAPVSPSAYDAPVPGARRRAQGRPVGESNRNLYGGPVRAPPRRPAGSARSGAVFHRPAAPVRRLGTVLPSPGVRDAFRGEPTPR